MSTHLHIVPDPAPRTATSPQISEDQALRPASFEEYVGQPEVLGNLRDAVRAAKLGGWQLDHQLFAGRNMELGDDRPYLGFPQWVYQRHELGIKVHRSRAEALQVFAAHARCRRDQAERERCHADQEVQWATAAAAACTEIAP